MLPYLDMPFQHASPNVLKAMRARPPRKRRSSASAPGARSALTCRSARRSSSAFPARPRRISDFLLDWLDEAKLDRVGAFQYEPVKGAAADDLGLAPVPDDIKASRQKRFMAEARRRSARRSSHAKVGKRLDVIVDEGGARRGQGPQQGRLAADRRRRAYRDAPAVARRRHRDRQDRALRRLRFMGDGGLRVANRLLDLERRWDALVARLP